jgi:prepilin-type processing-associated H-X9-DG protein
LAPYYEQGPLWDYIKAGDAVNPPEGPRAWCGWNSGSGVPSIAGWDDGPDILFCPSDEGPPHYGGNDCSYMFSVGDQVHSIRDDSTVRGIFSRQKCTRIRDIKDGTSNTVALSERLCQQDMGRFHGRDPQSANAGEVEIVKGCAELSGIRDNPIQCYTVVVGNHYAAGTGIRSRGGVCWHDGQPHYVGFNTVLPPNGPSCGNGGNWGDSRHMLIPPASRHPGGVNVLKADGSVDFTSETIDTGNLAAGYRQPDNGLSLYGVWGALGSKAGGEADQ